MPEVTELFTLLLQQPTHLDPEQVAMVEKFVVATCMYSKPVNSETCDAARRELFTSGRDMLNIPPTSDALKQHLLRAVYQSGHVWSQALCATPSLPSPVTLVSRVAEPC